MIEVRKHLQVLNFSPPLSPPLSSHLPHLPPPLSLRRVASSLYSAVVKGVEDISTIVLVNI